jgi:hypothetical protein
MEMWEAEHRLGTAQAWKIAYLSTFEALQKCQQERSAQQLQLPSQSVFAFQRVAFRSPGRWPDRARVARGLPVHPVFAPFDFLPSQPSTVGDLLVGAESPKNSCNKSAVQWAISATTGPVWISEQMLSNRLNLVLPRLDLINPAYKIHTESEATPPQFI